MSRVLITTTINVPHSLALWRKAGFREEDVFIVAGDQKTPHEQVKALLTSLPGDNRYLAPEDQEDWAISEVMGWNCIQRRNIALLEAIKLKPEWIITVDDDNYPIDRNHVGLVDDLLYGSNHDYRVIAAEGGWFDVGQLLSPSTVSRGFPINQRHISRPTLPFDREEKIGVVASLWMGSPDIDAIERIVNNPWVEGFTGPNVVLNDGTWCAFNSQATAYLTDLAHLMCVWPGVGRYDDIWSSYFARAIMDQTDYRVYYGHPLVMQERNPHNLVVDMEKEMVGYAFTDDVTRLLREARPIRWNQARAALRGLDSLKHWNPKVTEDLNRFFDAWEKDVNTLGIKL